MRKINIYRIEHKLTGLGPFQHGDQEVINSGVYGNIDAFADIDHLPEVKKILKQHKGSVFFGFSNKRKCANAIINKVALEECGFLIKTYFAEPLFISDDRQVLFFKESTQ